jgi:hypothetical protein
MLDANALQMKLNTINNSSIVNWQTYQAQYNNFSLASGDGLRHCYAWFKNDWFERGPAHDSIWVDLHCAVDTFYWTTTVGDTLYPGDTLHIHLTMQDDQIGAETGGSAKVNLGNILVNYPLIDNGNGNYSADYTVQAGPGIQNGILSLNFSDRAGNNIPSYNADNPINVFTNINLWEAGYYDTPGYAYGVAVGTTGVSGNYAYVADYSAGLRVVNISDPSAPYETGYYNTPGYAEGVAVSGNYAYVADGSSGLRVVNIASPTTPFEAGYYDTPGYAWGVAVSGNYAYVADYDAGLRIISIYGP